MVRPLPLLLALGLLVAPARAAGPVPVEVARRDGGWVLLRGGEPYAIRGAGGDGPLEALAAAGANSVRTWGVGPDTGALLDRAHALGLTVTVGIWLGHARHGFDYHDPAQVARQLAEARAAIERYKDHPAVLMWGLGNEMEGFGEATDPAVWRAVDAVAAMAKEVDPHHPTLTVTADLGGDRVPSLRRLCPHIDVHGINSYGGAPTLPARYRALGGEKPYVVTELGPPGAWEVPKTAWGAPLEPTSTEKAAAYRRAWEEAIAKAPGLALGGYAFTWGAKQEATATWYGMLLPDGSRLAAVDVLTGIWTGRPPPNRAPTVSPIRVVGAAVVPPGGRVEAAVEVGDPDGDPVTVSWALHLEGDLDAVGGDPQPPTPSFPEAVVEADAGKVRLRMPAGGGAYRLYATARDGKGGAAVASVPLRVDGPPRPPPAPRAALPFAVLGDDVKAPPYAPSGWMGDKDALALDPASADKPFRGATSLRVTYASGGGWAGVAWQAPANDWGDRPGGYDLSGARVLTFWARGARGGEKVRFFVGLLGPDKPFPDSVKAELEVTLGRRWQRYYLHLEGRDLSRVKTGFGFVVAGQGEPLTFWIDDVRYD